MHIVQNSLVPATQVDPVSHKRKREEEENSEERVGDVSKRCFSKSLLSSGASLRERIEFSIESNKTARDLLKKLRNMSCEDSRQVNDSDQEIQEVLQLPNLEKENRIDLLTFLGWNFFGKEMHADAVQVFEQAFELQRTKGFSSDVCSAFAVSVMEQIHNESLWEGGDRKKTELTVKRLNELYKVSEYLDPEAKVDVYYNLGRFYSSAGNKDRAIAFYEAALLIKADDSFYGESLGALAQALFERSEKENHQSEESLRRILELLALLEELPSSFKAQVQCALSLNLHGQGKLPEALELYRQACSVQFKDRPLSQIANTNLARLLFENAKLLKQSKDGKDLKLALDYINEALNLPCEDVLALYKKVFSENL